MKRELIRLSKVAKALDVNPRHLRNLCLKRDPATGEPKVNAVRIGRKWHIPVAEAERIYSEGIS